MKHLTKLEILQDFADNFVENPGNRSLNDAGNCKYLSPEGKKCAVGRWFTDEALGRLGESNRTVTDVYCTEDDSDDFLMPEVRGHEVTFWEQLQKLHDNESYWNDDRQTPTGLQTHAGVTPAGRYFYRGLVKYYSACE